MNCQYLLPQVKQSHGCNKTIQLPTVLTYISDFREQLEQHLLSAGYLAADNDNQAILKIQQVAYVGENVPATAQHEAYSLNIGDEFIVLKANSEKGAYYGLLTLQQIMKNAKGQHLAQLNIIDWPDLKTRAMHVTLGNGYMPTFERFMQLIPKLAGLKYNTLIIEYDDRFSWESHPVIPHKHAYTKDQVRAIIELAESHYLDAVPLVDSLGHAKQYLKHEEYTHLRELPDKIAEMCPNNPQTLDFMKEIWSEVLELHTNTKFAHVSGDEVFRQGDYCPKCKKNAEEGTLADAYLNYYTDLTRWMISKGKTPIVWGDMLIKYPQAVDHFPKDVIINDWCYVGIEDDELDCTYDIVDPEGKCDEQRQALFEPYWHNPGSRKFKEFPYFKFFKDRGFQVLAATASSKSGSPIPVPSLYKTFVNNKRFTRKVLEQNGEGFVNTFWTCSASFESGWFGTTAGADFSWHNREESFETFSERFSSSFLGLPVEFAQQLQQHENHQLKTPIEAESPTEDSVIDGYLRILKMGSALRCFDAGMIHAAANLHAMINGKAQFEPVDLKQAANTTVGDAMPLGAAKFEFADGRLAEPGIAYKMPQNIDSPVISVVANEARYEQVQNLTVNDKADKLCLLTMAHSAAKGEKVATMAVIYTDGCQCEFDFVAGVNTKDWWGIPALDLDAQLAWLGETKLGNTISAYSSIWNNPYTEKKIKAIEFTPDSDKARLIIAAVTKMKQSEYAVGTTTLAELEAQLKHIGKSLKELEGYVNDAYQPIMVSEDAKTGYNAQLIWRTQAYQRLTAKIEQLLDKKKEKMDEAV